MYVCVCVCDSELLKVEDVGTRMGAILFANLRNICIFECKVGKTSIFHNFFPIWQNSWRFYMF